MNNSARDIKGVTLITQVKLQGTKYIIAFNGTGSLMAAGYKKYIMVWNLIGRQRILRILTSNEDFIGHIVLSKKILWIVCGSSNGEIFSWNESWIPYKSEQKHIRGISHLQLNKNEDELISCCWGNTIKVWKINSQSNYIEYEYELEKIHSHFIHSLSLNQSESYLVSCSEDKSIILWYKKQNRWNFLNMLLIEHPVYHVDFITNSRFIFHPFPYKASEIVEIENDVLFHRPELQFSKNKDNFAYWQWFPVVYNKKKKIIITSHNGLISFFKNNEDGIQLIYGPKSGFKYDTFGAFTQNGEILILCNQELQGFRIYKIE